MKRLARTTQIFVGAMAFAAATFPPQSGWPRYIGIGAFFAYLELMYK